MAEILSPLFLPLVRQKYLSARQKTNTVARNVFFAGLDVELLGRAELLSDILWERDCDKTGDTHFIDFVIERLSAH